MPDCASVTHLVTPYVDGELASSDRAPLDAHLGACPVCRARVAAERAVRDLLQQRRADLCDLPAPAALRARCAALRADAGRAPLPLSPDRQVSWSAWRGRLAPFAAAAALVLVVGGWFLYQATARSSRVMAAELAADHVKCLAMNAALGTHASADTVQAAMASGFGWPMHLPARPESEGLELVGSRPCLYGEGRIAHIMYRHNGRPVSVFMLPHTERPGQILEVLGHQCAIWTGEDRTFVLVSRESRPEVERLAAFVQATLK